MYELLALRSAYEETDHSRLIQRITQGPPPAPESTNREIPRDLETIVLKAISHEVSQRYQSAEAMADDLRCYLEDRPIRARRVSPVERLGRWCRRNQSLAGLTGTTLLLIVLVAVVASIGYLRTKQALQGEASERAKAEANASLAIEALDRMFERFSPTRMRILPRLAMNGAGGETLEVPSSPILSKEAAALLEEMLPFYDRLAQQTGNDDKLRARTAAANRRVGTIRQRLGQSDEAAKAYRRAITLYQELGARSPANPSFKLELAQLENELGRLATSRQQVSEARQSHLAAMALLAGEAALPSATAAWRFELARTYYFLGTQARPLPAAAPRQGDRPTPTSGEQRDSLAKAVTLLRALPAAPPSKGEPYLDRSADILSAWRGRAGSEVGSIGSVRSVRKSKAGRRPARRAERRLPTNLARHTDPKSRLETGAPVRWPTTRPAGRMRPPVKPGQTKRQSAFGGRRPTQPRSGARW